MKVPYISKELLDNYLAGQCTEEERQQVETWFQSFNGTTDYLNSLDEQEQNKIKKENLSKIKKKIRHQENTISWGRWTKPIALIAAASVALLITIFFWPHTPQPMEHASLPIYSEPMEGKQDWIQFTNNDSKIVSHLLSDGSTVWLHHKASIQYPSEFDKSHRTVQFEGEGFFDIQRNPDRPFLIQAGSMKIRVLGTSFNVKARAHEKIYEVAVVTGQVTVTGVGHKPESREIKLNPSEQAFFESNSEKITRIKVPDQPKKELFEPVSIVFNDNTLSDAIAQLEQRFDVKIHVVNPDMTNCRITADFEQQPLMMILEMLCTTLEATYSLSGKNILLEGPPCNH